MAFELFHLLGRISYDGDKEVVESLDKTDRLLVQVDRQFRKLEKTAAPIGRRIGRSFSAVGRQLVSLKAAAAGVGTGLLIKGFIGASASAENYRTRLTRILGSQEEANRLFADMSDLAGRVPFEYEKIMDSATSLAAVMEEGREEVNKWMPVILDLSATSGLALDEATANFIRMVSSGAAAADMFRERGILNMLGFKSGVSYTAEETRKKLWEEWEKVYSRFRNATIDMADDWEGLTSMMGDRWFQFRERVGRAGLFDAAKQAIQGVLDKLEELDEAGDLDRFAEKVSDTILEAAAGVGGLLAGLGKTINFISSNPLIAEYGLIGYFLLGAKGAAGLAALGWVVEEIIDDIDVSAQGNIEEKVKFYEALVDQWEKRKEMLERRRGSALFNQDKVQEDIEEAEDQLEHLYQELNNWQRTLDDYEPSLALPDDEVTGLGNALIDVGQFVQDLINGILEAQRQVRGLGKEFDQLPPAPDRPELPVLEGLGPDFWEVIPDEVAILSFWERLGQSIGRALEGAEDLQELTAGILLRSFNDLGSAIEDAFSGMVDGSQAAGRSLVSGLLGALAVVARGFGEFFLQQAAGSLGQALLTKDPAALRAAGLLSAAATAMFALAGTLGGYGNLAASGGSGGGGGGSTGSSIPQAGEALPPETEINVWIDPFDPRNPVHQRQVSEATYRYGERGGRFSVNVRRAQ